MANLEGKYAVGFPGQGLDPEVISRFSNQLKEIDGNLWDSALAQVQLSALKINKTFVDLNALAANPSSPEYKRTSSYQLLVHGLNLAAYAIAKDKGKIN